MAAIKSKLLEAARKQLKALSELEAEIGVLENTRPYPDSDISVVEVATIHEYGTERIPERSFLRIPIREHRGDIIKKVVKENYRSFIAGEMTAEEFLRHIGSEAVDWSVEAFDTGGFGQWDPHEDSTVKAYARKGIAHSELLKLSGALKNAVIFKVVKK